MSNSANHIAIVGMSGRFPGAADVAAFWRVLVEGTDAIGHFSENELEYRNADALPGVRHVGARGVLDRVDEFDAEFFGITPREAELMDPQHRLFLQCCWHALEDAGYDPAAFKGLIGVYAGVSLNTYLLYNLQNQAAELAGQYQVGAYQTMLGNDKDFMPTRVSYKLGLRGPSMAVQTACSTSLVAVAQACQALLSYQADLCLAGGVSISFPQKRDYPYTEDAMASSDGHCRPFDAGAQGTVFGHGVGVVALRRFDDALKDGDHILAVIRGSAVNNDGAAKIGFAAPSVDGQAEVIAMAQALSEVDPASISYVEAHGTGTPLGDPIEIAALAQAFRRGTRAPLSCTIGTGKGNIGHLDVAAGVTGLIKTVLQMQHRTIPPVLHFRTPNPRLDLGQGFRIADRLLPWQGPRPLRAGVSAFGVGGTNAHVVVEEAPTTVPRPSSRTSHLLTLSARSSAALDTMVERLRAHLADHDLPLADVSFTLQTGRRTFAQRCIVVCDDRGVAIRLLAEPTRLLNAHVAGTTGVAFLFPGQGAQHAGMAAGIYRSEPLFRQELDRLCTLAEPHLGFDLRTVLYPTGDATAAHDRLRQTEVAQPALFIIGLALAKLWHSWGVTAQAMIGHSVGEYVAAVLAGIMSEHDALRLVALRGRLIQALPPGTMLSVRLSEADLLPRLPPGCSIAAVNGPQLCVASGPVDAIAALEARLTSDGIVSRPLKTSHAFHSAMMDPILARFAEVVTQVRLSPPTIPLVSCVSGTWLTATQATDPQYWVAHVRATVRFADAVTTLRREQPHAFLEVGPGRTLTTLARQMAGDDPRAVIASLPTPAESAERSQPVSDTATVMEALGRLWLAGVAIDWVAVHASEPRQRVSLPGYPFARTRFWIAPPADAVPPPATCPSDITTIPAASSEGFLSMASAPTPPAPTGGGGRRASLLAALRGLLSELSGTPPERLDPTAGFIELGFDSLLLTQVSMAIQSRFKGKVTFRQLLGDIGSLDALTDHLDRTLPPEAFASPVTNTPGKATSLPPASGTETALELLIRRQMEMMAEQLVLLKGGTSQPPAPATATPVPTPVKEAEFKTFGPYKSIQRGPSGGLTAQQQNSLDRLIARYTAKTAKSKELTQQHRSHLADPRVAAGFRAQWKELVYPIITTRSKGTRLWDVDGNEYIDLLNGFGCILFGHAPDFVVEAVNRQMAQGYEIGPQTLLAGEAAKLMCEMTGLDRATFCNTGSEAVMAAMRLARTVTGRMRIVSFLGDYHGTFDEVLTKSVGADHRSLPIAPGIPQGKVDNLTVLPYGTDESLAWIRAHADELAAVLIEPVQSRHPALQPKAFIQEIRRITAASGSAMIMDEVITGFRTHPGGAQALFGVKADLASYGKVIGGGMPIGVLCGNRRFMDALDGGMWQYGDDSFPEVGVTFFAGTFVRHPVTMAAVVACLEHLKREGGTLQATVDAKCAQLVGRLGALFRDRGVPTTIEHFSSWFYFTFAPEHRHGSLLYYLLRERGVHIQEGFPCFLTTAHSEADLERIYQAFASAVDELVTNGFFPDPSGRVNEHERDLSVATAPATTEPVTTPAGNGSVVALGASQHEVWLASRLSDEASCAYNESITLRLRGRLDETALHGAWDTVVARHEALRAQFTEDGSTQQFIADRRIPLNREDWRSLAQDERDRRMAGLIRNEAETSFDLVHGPLVRAILITLDATDHALVITAHHLVCDGWSMNVVCDELGRLYSARINHTTCDLRPTLGLGGYVRWQQQQATKPEAKTSADHWRQRFAAVPALPDLPTDHSRPGQRTYEGDTVRHRLTPDLHRALKRVAAQHKATLFTTMLSAFQALILRLSGQDDVVVGVPLAGQTQLDEEGDFLVGHCVNFLPLRARIAGDRSLAEQLPNLQRAVLVDFAHQDYTYGSLLNDLTLTRDPSRLPLSEVQFNLERWASALTFAGLEVAFDSNPKRFVVFDLFINAVESDEGLLLVCDFNRSLFNSSTILRWLGHFETLLKGFVAAPTTPVATLPLLTDRERSQILNEWNATTVGHPAPHLLHRLIEDQVERTPDSIAIIAGTDQVTYRELSRRIAVLSAHLRARGIGPGSLVAVCVPRSIQMTVALLGTLAAGAAYVPLDARYPATRIAQIIEDARPALVLTQAGEWTPFAGIAVATLDLDAGWERRPAEVAAATLRPPNADDLAYVIYTSGSTGRPKGVQIQHRAVVNFLYAMRHSPGFTSRDRLLAVTTISFDIAVLELFAPLICGATVIIADRETAADGKLLAALLESSRTTIFQATPVTMRMLVEAGWSGNPRIKLLCGGEALSRELADRLLPKCGALWNMYGPTETTVWSSADRVEAGEQPVLIGTPIANTRFHILDSALQPKPIGVVGDLYIGGEGLALGYLHLPDQNATRFIRDPFSNDPRARLYATGDVARYQPDGRIEFLGRADHQTKIRGFRIELGEIEEHLASHPAVRQRVAVARSANGDGEAVLIAYVSLRAGMTTTAAELRRHLRGRLPEYMIPTAIEILAELPLTPNGKIDRKALPALISMNAGSATDQAPLVPHLSLHFQLIQLWEEVLNTRCVRLDDDFFALGGNSLLAFRMMNALEQLIDRRLPMSKLFTHPTIAQLSAAVMSEAEIEERPLLEIQAGSVSAKPFFYLHGDYLGGGYYCSSFARKLGKDVPFYALVPPRLDPNAGFPTIEQLATEHIRQMRAISPTGPYNLGGFCIGGVIAFEIAHQLRAQGHTVGLLAMVDAETAYGQQRLIRRIVRTLGWLSGMSPKRQLTLFASINQRVERLRHVTFGDLWRHLLIRCGLRRPTETRVTQSSLLVAIPAVTPTQAYDQLNAYLWTVSGYRPRPLPMPLHLFTSDEFAAEFSEPTAGWHRLSSGVTVTKLPGNHLESITRNLPLLAKALRPLIEQDKSLISQGRPLTATTPATNMA